MCSVFAQHLRYPANLVWFLQCQAPPVDAIEATETNQVEHVEAKRILIFENVILKLTAKITVKENYQYAIRIFLNCPDVLRCLQTTERSRS